MVKKKTKWQRRSQHTTYELARKTAVRDKLKDYKIVQEGVMFQIFSK